jgi:hypothetical protein
MIFEKKYVLKVQSWLYMIGLFKKLYG